MYRRKLENIVDWIRNDKNHTLLVTGARRVGKTYLIREALKQEKCDYIELNFIKNKELADILKNYKDVEDLELRLSLTTNKELKPGKTIFFFDEVQEVKDIVTMSKFLVEKTKYRYIMSGALLGVELNDLRSAPVGYMNIINMFPMDLYEFYKAVGIQENVIEAVHKAFDNRETVDVFIHDKLMALFNIYMIVGGMPEAVKAYIETNDLRKVSKAQSNIIELYKKDFSKYSKLENLILNEVFDAIPEELNKKNKRYYIKHINGKTTFDSVKINFEWLSNAGVTVPVYKVIEPKAPLLFNKKRSIFKLFLSDVGLLTNMFSDEIKLMILNNDKDISNGAVFENFVVQELISRKNKLYYYDDKSQGEVDFIIEYHGNALPIEVKLGKIYKKHCALNNLLKNKNYEIDKAFILNRTNISVAGGKIYMPIYMIMFIEMAKTDMIIKPNLDGLCV